MKIKTNRSENAVSPVVGVMLMLVVTIIIAAVVSSFAGGLSESTSTTPQAIMDAELKYHDALTLNHKGGDSISGSNVNVVATVKSGLYADMVYNVNLDNATLSNGEKLKGSTVQTGTTITNMSWNNDIFNVITDYGRMEPKLGDLVEIVVIDTASGKPISKKTVTVQ